MVTSNVGWLCQTIIGGIFGALIPYAIKAIIITINRRKIIDICGSWNTHSFIMLNKTPKIITGEMTIKRGIMSLYTVRVNENGFVYKGNVIIENDHLIFTLRTNNELRTETSFIRMDRSPCVKKRTLHGYWLSLDFDNKLSCGSFVMSRDRIVDITLEIEVNKISKRYLSNTISRIEY